MSFFYSAMHTAIITLSNNAISDFFALFLNNTIGKIVTAFFMSMIPIIELRGAIPYAYGVGINPWVAFAVCILGNLVPVPFIILFIRQIFALMRKHVPKLDGLVTRLEKRAEKKSAVLQKSAFWGLFILVAIPLPGTGAWTGALVAAMLDMRLKRAFPSIALGVTAASAIVTIAMYTTGSLLF